MHLGKAGKPRGTRRSFPGRLQKPGPARTAAPANPLGSCGLELRRAKSANCPFSVPHTLVHLCWGWNQGNCSDDYITSEFKTANPKMGRMKFGGIGGGGIKKNVSPNVKVTEAQKKYLQIPIFPPLRMNNNILTYLAKNF